MEQLRCLQAKLHTLGTWHVFKGILASLRLDHTDQNVQVVNPVTERWELNFGSDRLTAHLLSLLDDVSFFGEAFVPLNDATIQAAAGATRAKSCIHSELARI